MPTVDVSVVITTYNRVRFLREAMDSVFRAVRGLTFECLVVDDGSTDDTAAFVSETFGNAVTVIPQEHQGIHAARNLGLRRARGRYVKFLDSDDLLGDTLPEEVRLLDATGTDMAYGAWRFLVEYRGGGWEAQRPPARLGDVPTPADILRATLVGRVWPNGSFLLRRAFLLTSGLSWNEDFKHGVEEAFITRLLLAHAAFVSCPGIFMKYREYSYPARASRDPHSRFSVTPRIFRQVEERLLQEGKLTPDLRDAFAHAYLRTAKLAFGDPALFAECIHDLTRVCPNFRPPGRLWYRLAVTLLGYHRAEALCALRKAACWKRASLPFRKPERGDATVITHVRTPVDAGEMG